MIQIGGLEPAIEGFKIRIQDQWRENERGKEQELGERGREQE